MNEKNENTFVLNNGVLIPDVAFGTYKAAAGDTSEVILNAIEAGYRCFDTASFYGTEEYLADAIKKSGIPREKFFITSKLWKTELGYDNALSAFEASLKRLNTDYLDAYLIHWPLPDADYKDWRVIDFDSWQALEKLYNEGVVNAIGVSNFLPHHIENIIQNCEIEPAINQIEFHPGYSQLATVEYCLKHNILVQAWSPLGRTRVLDDPLICELAEKYKRQPAQICLRFAYQMGVMPLPKSSDTSRMKTNMAVFDFEISQEDMYRLQTMPPTGWSGLHPDR